MTLSWTSKSEAKLPLYEIHVRQAGCSSLCMSDEVCIFFYLAVFLSYLLTWFLAIHTCALEHLH